MNINNLLSRFGLSAGTINIFNNLAWAVLGKVVNLLSGLVVGIIIARYLGPKQYGLMNYVIGYVFLFQILSTFGLDNIEAREEARRPHDKDKIIGSALAIRLLFGFIAVALSVSTSFYLEADTYVTLLVLLYSSTVLFSANQVIRNYFFSIVQNEYVVKTEITTTVLGIFLKLFLLYIHADLPWFVFACAIDPLLVAIGYVIAYRSKVGDVSKWKFSYDEALYLCKEGLPLMLTSAAVIIYQRIDTVMIGQMVDQESVGYFSVASRFVEVLIYIPMILAQTIMPVLVKARKENEDEYRRRSQLFMNVSVWLSLICSGIMSLCAYPVIVLLFGESYLPAVVMLQVMSFKAASVALSNTAGAIIVTEGLQKWAILRDGLGCIVCILLNVWLLPIYGAIAACVTVIISNIVAGYIADALVPAYRHVFRMQTETLLVGWRDLRLSRVKNNLRR